MTLKERIIKEMVVEKEMFEEIKSIIDILPLEMQTHKNFILIEELLKLEETLNDVIINTGSSDERDRQVNEINDMIELRIKQLRNR